MINSDSISFKVNGHTNSRDQGNRSDKKRLRLFEDKVNVLSKPVTIIDLGGTIKFWVEAGYHEKDVLITIIKPKAEKSGYANIRVIAGNACDLSTFKDKAFDISFSNSLFEHLFTKENQFKMAGEAIRVGTYFFIQTSNRYFPLEHHFKFPFFQFLPRFLQIFLQTKTSLIHGVRHNYDDALRIVEEIRLPSKSEMKVFFPESNLHIERYMGIAKSFLAYNFQE